MIALLRIVAIALVCTGTVLFGVALWLGDETASERFAIGTVAAVIVLALVEGFDSWLDNFGDDWTIHG